MGLFDNLKKKRNAKALGLSVEQYDQYVTAQAMNINLESFKRYLASFSDKYSLEQFAQYLALESAGHTAAQCQRYLSELSGKVSVTDYADFLAAEQLGLSVSEYAAYAASLKSTMSAVDYVGFLQAQKIGLTMGKYLKYLKSFKGEMTIEEYDTYLKAEAHGMDHDRYMEYLQMYKDQYTIERYIEFDKARSLGMTLEEYDLRLEASKQGMSLEEYKDHLAAKSMGISADEYAAYKDILESGCIQDHILTIPQRYHVLPKNVFRHLSFNRVIFPSGITEIADAAFAGCSELSEITIPATVHTIGDESFKDCSALTSATIPGTVKNVGYHAFQGCSSLQTLQFEEGVEEIDISDWVDLPALSCVVTPATASLQHLPSYRDRDPRYGIINKDMRFHIGNETKVEYIFASQYGGHGLAEHQSEIEYLEVYGDFVFLELADFPNLKTVIFSAKGRIESIKNCPALQMIYYSDYMEAVTQESILVYRGLRAAQATLSLKDFDAPNLRFLAVNNGVRQIDFAHYAQADFTWIHKPVAVAEVEQIVEAPVEVPEATIPVAAVEAEQIVEAPAEVPETIIPVAVAEVEQIVEAPAEAPETTIPVALEDAQIAPPLQEEKTEEVVAVQTITVTLAQQFSINIPHDYTYSTDASVIGDNRALIAILHDAAANFQDPYSATESITILNGQPVNSVREAAAIAATIGLSDAQVLVDGVDLNVRYTVSESTDDLTIVLALICTPTKSFPAQFFFNGSSNPDAVAAVRNILLTITPERVEIPKTVHQPAPAVVADVPPAEPVVKVAPSDDTPSQKPYPPGQEPPKLRARVERFFRKLHEAYPDKIIVGLDKDHKHWAETAVALYRELGYENKKDFFAAYGYSTGNSENKGGRPKKDHNAIVDELKRRYAGGPTCATMAALKAENPDLASRFHNLSNQANTLFGMPLAKYFIQEGILVGKLEVSYAEEFEKLKSRYAQAPFAGTLSKLKSANSDIDWSSISKYHSSCQTTGDLKDFLVAESILTNQEALARTKLNEVMEQLKKRYPADKPFLGTLEKLNVENSDLHLEDMHDWTRLIHNLSLSEYLTQQGILATEKSAEYKLAAITETLKERYASGEKKVYSLSDLRQQNQDLPISTIGTWSKKVCGQSASEYLIAQGILSKYDWMDSVRIENERRAAEAKAREEQLQAEMAAPVQTTYYEPPVYYVKEIEVSGEEAKDWVCKDTYWGKEGQLVIDDYIGDQQHIIVPTHINGKRVMGFGPACFTNCKAEVIEIPGTIKEVSGTNGYGNEHIRAIVIGEGVQTIESSFLSAAKNLNDIKVSKSVQFSNHGFYTSVPFSNTPWFKNQYGCVILGDTMVGANGERSILRIPEGVKRVCSYATIEMPNLRKIVISDTVTELCDNAFASYDVMHVQEIVVPKSVIRIGANAFGRSQWISKQKGSDIIINDVLYASQTSEETVVIPEGIISVAAEAFKDNAFIKQIVFPSTLKEIGNQAFSECKNLSSIHLPEGVERLGIGCFYRCAKLTKISLPNSLIEIGRSAFNSCSALKEVKIGERTERIGERAFLECKKLQTVHMPDTVKKIGKEAFQQCIALKTVTLSSGLREIGSQAFYGCTALETICIPDGVDKIPTSAFCGCKSLKEVVIPAAVEEFSESVFFNCESLQEIRLPRKLGRQALAGCNSLRSVKLAEGTENIPASCFANCSALTDVTLPSTLTKIQDSAFKNCVSLTAIMLPAGLQEIGTGAFSACSSITQLAIPESITAIRDNAFKDCIALEQVDMPNTVSEFGMDVFTNTPYIKKQFGEFVIINGLLSKYLGSDTEVVIPDNVTAICENAFAEACHVETIIIPDSVTAIGKKIMGDVDTWSDNPRPQLKKLVLGNGVSKIGEEAFAGCDQIAEITFGKGLKVIGANAFSNCTALTAIDLSATGVTQVCQEAFRGCYNVKTLILPPAVEIIGRGAFSEIHVSKIALPKTVRTVERSSFSEVSELIVYDTIDPSAEEAHKWQYSRWNGSVNSALACAMLDVPQGFTACQGNTNWRSYHITVLSAETEKVRYRIFCDSEERDDYLVIMFSGWGKHASFHFEAYDAYFMRTRNALGRTEMAFCRIEYPEGLSAQHRANYEAFLERCLFIERSAKRTAEMIAHTDAVERLKILHQYRAIDAHNIDWIRQPLLAQQATKCLQFLDETFSK